MNLVKIQSGLKHIATTYQDKDLHWKNPRVGAGGDVVELGTASAPVEDQRSPWSSM